MTNIPAVITGVGAYVPPDVLTNIDLEKMVETNDEWIRSRTGIAQRHILKEEGKATSDMCQIAVERLLEKTNLDPKEIDLIIVGSVTGDYVFPDTATITASKVGATNAFGFELRAACSGFLYSLSVGAKFINSGQYKKVIVVGADMMSSIIDYTDRATCILFGDGAGAVLLEPGEEGYGLHDEVLYGDGTGAEFLYQKAGGSKHPATAETVKNREHFAFQNGRPVFKAAVMGMSTAIKEIMNRNQLEASDIHWLVPHQANQRIIDAVGNQLDFPAKKVMSIIENYGNTTAATLPLCLSEYESKLKKGDKIIFTAFGGGYTWGASYLTWAYDG